MGFEWDEEKAAINFRKHGIAFKTATRVFQDENRLVIYVERAENIRIISARLATKREKEMYYGNSVL